MSFSITEIIIYFIVINIITFVLFGMDKRSARNGTWRIKEKTLLIFCLLGGTPAGFFARKLYRHKTKKNSFRAKFLLVFMAQIFAMICLIMNQMGLI